MNTYLDEFEADLRAANLADKTIGRHVANAELFLDWLTGHEAGKVGYAAEYIDGFLGDWYIRRCMWSTPANIKTTAASLKKLFKSMVDHGHLAPDALKHVRETIKSDLPEWQHKCALYNDPYLEWDDISDEFGF